MVRVAGVGVVTAGKSDKAQAQYYHFNVGHVKSLFR